MADNGADQSGGRTTPTANQSAADNGDDGRAVMDNQSGEDSDESRSTSSGGGRDNESEARLLHCNAAADGSAADSASSSMSGDEEEEERDLQRPPPAPAPSSSGVGGGGAPHPSAAPPPPPPPPLPPPPPPDISPENLDKLIQFQSLSGIDDLEICRALLESKEWDLLATVTEHMNESFPEPHPPRPRAAPADAEDDGAEQIPQGLRRRPNGPQRLAPIFQAAQSRSVAAGVGGRGRADSSVVAAAASLWDWAWYLLTLPVAWPIRLVVNAVNGLSALVSSVFGGGGGARQTQRSSFFGQASLDPVADVRCFRETFAARYGPTSFHAGSYNTVLEEARRDLRFLLVYIHSPEHQDTERFCRETLQSDELQTFLAANNVLLWGCSVDTREGYRVSQTLSRESTYPFLAVIVLRQHRMIVVGRIEGFIGANALVDRLLTCTRDNEAFVVAAGVDRQERNLNQEIREEQDAAFAETLRQDQERDRQREEEERLRREEEEEAARVLRADEELKARIQRLKVDLVAKIPCEPNADQGDVIKIVVKLPSGTRLERRFLRSHSLHSLWYFIFCHPDSPDDFEVIGGYPRKALPCKPSNVSLRRDAAAADAADESEGNGGETQTFESAGLGKSEMLLVTNLDA